MHTLHAAGCRMGWGVGSNSQGVKRIWELSEGEAGGPSAKYLNGVWYVESRILLQKAT